VKKNNTHHTRKHHQHNPRKKAKSVTRYRWCLSHFRSRQYYTPCIQSARPNCNQHSYLQIL